MKFAWIFLISTWTFSGCGKDGDDDAKEQDDTASRPESDSLEGETDEQPSDSDENPGETDEQPSDSDENPGETDEQPSDSDENPGETDTTPEDTGDTELLPEVELPEGNGTWALVGEQGFAVSSAMSTGVRNIGRIPELIFQHQTATLFISSKTAVRPLCDLYAHRRAAMASAPS